MFRALAIFALTFTVADARSREDLEKLCDRKCERVTDVEERLATCTVIDPSGSYGTTGTVDFAQTRTKTSWVSEDNADDPCSNAFCRDT